MIITHELDDSQSKASKITMQQALPIVTTEIQKKDIRRLRRLQVRSIIRDSRGRGERRARLNEPLLQQTPPRPLFPNHPENYVAPFPIRRHIFIVHAEKKKKKRISFKF